jgi:hypothetical protein
MRFLLSLLLTILLAPAALAHDRTHGDSYVLREGDVTFMLGDGMGSQALQGLQARYGREFLWARRGGRTLLVTDRATLLRAYVIAQSNLARDEQARRLGLVIDAAVAAKTAHPAN